MEWMGYVATAPSRMAKAWESRRVGWSWLRDECLRFRRTGETQAQFDAMGKDERGRTKDVGGFVGGYLKGGRRSASAVDFRDVITLDFDSVRRSTEDFAAAVREAMGGCAYALYSTHSHRPEAPRLRLVAPMSHSLRPRQYEAAARRLASLIGIEEADDTTYQAERLMYWPSCPADAEPFADHGDGPAIDVDALLASYADPLDPAQWPRSQREGTKMAERERAHAEQRPGTLEDPEGKGGLVGAFCRTYDVHGAIARYLADVYARGSAGNRYTFVAGHMPDGLEVYDGGKFARPWNETDPAGGKLRNAWDLVRLHLCPADSDEESQRLMERLARADEAVAALERQEADAALGADFDGCESAPAEEEQPKTAKKAAKRRRRRSGDDDEQYTAEDICQALRTDEALRGKLLYNQLANRFERGPGLPWEREGGRWRELDAGNLRIYLESAYGYTGKDKIADAMGKVAAENRYDPLVDYFGALPQWDGTPRLDSVFIDHLGADDTRATRLCTRLQMIGAVRRALEPGCKFDYVLTLAGPEGCGKSSILRDLAVEWFSDSITVTETSKDGMEQLVGIWMAELAEMQAMKRSTTEATKAFISKQVDEYRPAYGRYKEEYKRRCVFFATTNESHFLKGDTGNRRFWIVPIGSPKEYDSDALLAVREQIWAEALAAYLRGDATPAAYKEAERLAKELQDAYNDDADDPLPGMLDTFLDSRLPPHWHTYGLGERRAFWRMASDDEMRPAVVERETVCVAEFVCEFLGLERSDFRYKSTARRVGKLMAEKADEWEYAGPSREAPRMYGAVQKLWRKIPKKCVTESVTEGVTEDDL